MEPPPEDRRRSSDQVIDLTAVAEPFETVDAAVESVIHGLAEQGIGRWALVDDALADGPADDVLTIELAVPDDPRVVALRALTPPPSELTAQDQGSLLRASRTIATLIAADRKVTHLRELADRAERASETDELTGLANARGWWRTLAREAARCDRRKIGAVVAVIDLDELKLVNDGDGHLAGDLLLERAGRALQAAVRSHDLVARIGGDEFGVLAVDYAPDDPSILVGRLEDHLETAGVRASVGAAVYAPDGRINETYRLADAAMYVSKRAAGGTTGPEDEHDLPTAAGA